MCWASLVGLESLIAYFNLKILPVMFDCQIPVAFVLHNEFDCDWVLLNRLGEI